MSSITFFYGAADAAFAFTMRELSMIDRALGELISYEEDWVNDDRESVVQHAEEQIEKCTLLQTKIDHYRNEILKYLQQEVEDEEWMREEDDPCICIPDEPNLMCESCF